VSVYFRREKGEILDRGLIENLEELFGVGPHTADNNKTRFTIDGELPNVLDSTSEKKQPFDVEYGVSSEVINMMAKNLEGLEQGLSLSKMADTGGGGGGEGDEDEMARVEPMAVEQQAKANRIVRVKTVADVGPGGGPPPGALAKIVIVANRRLDQTRIVFATVDGREQHSFCVNSADIRYRTGRYLRGVFQNNPENA